MNIIRKTGVWISSASAVLILAGAAAAHAATNCDSALCNPLNAQFSDIPTFIAGFLQVVVLIALPIIVLFFVIAGFKFISAQGNPTALGEARKNFMWVVIGALLIMGAWVLATLIAGTVSQLVGPSPNQNVVPGIGQNNA
ncbi:MAG: pilin [bacterium]|nr:pilin [bacterium]